MKGSGPVSIPSTGGGGSGSGGGRARSRSDHIYSKSEGHRGGPSFHWPPTGIQPSDQVDFRRRGDDTEVGSLGGAAPFLIVEPSSLNSDSSLNIPIEYRCTMHTHTTVPSFFS
jgi:hypothetical protein